MEPTVEEAAAAGEAAQLTCNDLCGCITHVFCPILTVGTISLTLLPFAGRYEDG